jgi:hypothetical protein
MSVPPITVPNQSCSEPLTWHYDARFRLITHDTSACDTCDSWGHHFVTSAYRRDASLRFAEEQRNNDMRNDLYAANSILRDENETLHSKLLARDADLARFNDELAQVRKELEDADNVSRILRANYDDLNQRTTVTIAELHQQISDLEYHRPESSRRRKMARRSSHSRPHSRYEHHGACTPPSRPSRSISPMADDREELPARPPTAPPRLLSRLTQQELVEDAATAPAASSSDRPSHPSEAPVSLASRISEAGLSSAYFASPTPLVEKLGFPALLPVIYHENRELQVAGGSARLDSKGNLDFTFHDRFVFAIGRITAAGKPAWSTTLVYREYFYRKEVQAAMSLRLPLPLSPLIVGGENGVLISPDHDPQTEEKLDQLFASPKKRGRAAGYIERVRYTPPELRGDLHSHALEKWQELLASRREEGEKIKRPEPDPTADNNSWRRWLKNTRALHKGEDEFKYSGIPLIGRGYQTPHIEGMKALLCFLPRQRRGSINAHLRNQFLHSAAALLSVPERYLETLTRLKKDIAPEHRALPLYDEKSFGTADHIHIDNIASFLAHCGITTAEAEQWRAWATAYVEMELEREPDGNYAPLLKKARGMAIERVSKNPKWVIRTVSPMAPGNYNPTNEYTRVSHHESPSDDADAPTTTAAAPSPDHRDDSLSSDTHSDSAEEEIRSHYDIEQDDDSRMGPG